MTARTCSSLYSRISRVRSSAATQAITIMNSGKTGYRYRRYVM